MTIADRSDDFDTVLAARRRDCGLPPFTLAEHEDDLFDCPECDDHGELATPVPYLTEPCPHCTNRRS